MSPSLHVLRSSLDQESIRRIRIDLLQLYSRLSEVDAGLSEELPDRIDLSQLREKTQSLLVALRNL